LYEIVTSVIPIHSETEAFLFPPAAGMVIWHRPMQT
jgi:hypothetical protein